MLTWASNTEKSCKLIPATGGGEMRNAELRARLDEPPAVPAAASLAAPSIDSTSV